MLRAISEIASAIIVWSVLENPVAAASSRPFWRAATMSPSCSIGTVTSGCTWAPRSREGADVGEPFLEVERRRHALQREAELHHREGDLGLDADDDRVR